MTVKQAMVWAESIKEHAAQWRRIGLTTDQGEAIVVLAAEVDQLHKVLVVCGILTTRILKRNQGGGTSDHLDLIALDHHIREALKEEV